jgi:hypothetical protein
MTRSRIGSNDDNARHESGRFSGLFVAAELASRHASG